MTIISPGPKLNTPTSVGNRTLIGTTRQAILRLCDENLRRPAAICDTRPVQQRLASMINPPIGFGHRGAKGYAPENTMESFRLALKLGATGLESDVWLTADGIAVLDHDGVVRERLRKRPIADIARADLPDHIPSLADVCALHHETAFHLSLDVKDAAAAEPTVAAVREHAPALLTSLWLCHPSFEVVASWRHHYEPKLVWSTNFDAIKAGPERHAAAMRERSIDVLNLHHTAWTGGLVALFHRFERLTLAWDLQHEHQLDNLVRMGIDGVFSDYPDRAVTAISRG
jgi:glycerophosphoryl diester phosphodiesterase